MSPEKQKEIKAIVEKIGDFLNTLAEEHADFDIRLVKFDIESHSEDEVDEKDTLLQVTINDCGTIAKEEAEEDRKEAEYREQVKKEVEEEETQKKEKQNKKNEKTESKEDNKNLATQSDTQGSKEQNQDDISVTNQDDCNTVSTNETQSTDSEDEQPEKSDLEATERKNVPKSKPTLMYLNLSENAQDVMEILEEKRGKRPILVFIEQVNGQQRIILPGTK